MEQQITRRGVVHLVVGSLAWGAALFVISIVVERLGVHALWQLLPLSCLLASLAMWVARIPNMYQGDLVREPRFGRWFARQLFIWGVLSLVMRYFRA